MTFKEAIKEISNLLGIHKFKSYKEMETEQEFITENELEVGEDIYVITDNGHLPLADGDYILEDTTKIKVEDGKVQEIKYDTMAQDEKFVEATLADGTLLKSNTFDVGEEVYVVGPEGETELAPDGEHEIFLKDEEGNDVRIKIITKDGVITERENVELSEEDEVVKVEEEMGDLSETDEKKDLSFEETITEKLEEIMEKLEDLTKEYEEMKGKVNKFSKEPAGEPVRQPKNKLVSEFSSIKDDAFTKLLKVRHGLK